MSMTTTSLSDTLPSTVPKLDATGINWAIFSVRFQDAVEAKGFWDHFDGTSACPTLSTTPTADETAAKKQWEKDERSAKSLLTQKIPDSTLMRVHSKTSVKEQWDAIVKEYTDKGAYAQTELRTKFLESRCPDKGNIREFLEGLRVKKEELARVGVTIDDKDYLSTIVASLPFALSNFASSQLTAARMYSSTKTIDPDLLISLLVEESDRQRAQYARRKFGSKGKEGEKDEALGVTPDKGRKPRKDVECWNCGGKGHFRHQCKKPKKQTESKKGESKTEEPKKPEQSKSDGRANAAESDSDSEGEGAWFLEDDDNESIASDDSLPGLQELSDSDDDDDGEAHTGFEDWEPEEPDWFSDAPDDDDEDIVAERDEDTIENLGDVSGEALAMTDSSKLTHRTELYDSGCTNHISPFREQFENYVDITPKRFRAANQETFSAIGRGELVVDVPNGSNFTPLRLEGALYAPEVGYTLVSMGQLDEAGFFATFGGGECVIIDPDGNQIGSIPKTAKRLYKVIHEGEIIAVAKEVLTPEQFHRRMGHVSIKTTCKLVDGKHVLGVRLDGTPDPDKFFCESCVYAKATRKPVPKKREGDRAQNFADEIHSDLWGKAPIESKGGKRYWITFTDDKTRLTWLNLLHKKSEAFKSYKTFEALVETQFGRRIKVLNIDRGGEYLGANFDAHCKAKGIVKKLSVHDTHQEAGVSERRNRTIAERIRALLHASGLPKYLWGEAARHVVWLLNRTTTKAVNGITPYEAAFGKKPNLKNVREWGEKVWVRIEKGNKLGGRVRKGHWLGIDEESKGIRVWWPDTKTVGVERNVYYDNSCSSASHFEGENDGREFVETRADEPFVSPEKSPTVTKIPPETPETPSATQTVAVPVPDPEPREKRARKPSQRVQDILEGRAESSKVARGVQLPTQEVEGGQSADWVDEYALAAEIGETEALEPRTLAEARKRPDWHLWEKAIQEELATLKTAGTWELVDAPEDANIVGSKWVFRAKKDAAGNVVRYKARLVAQGFSQVPGVDYFDTFAPVARLASIRAVLAFAAAENYETGQIDIKGAYLNGELTNDEVIYMKQPPGYSVSDPKGKVLVCRLRKTLYGLKQSGRRWYQKLVSIMEKLGFKRCQVDQAVFFRRGGKKLIIVLVHVDDCTITANTTSLITGFKTEIAKHVDITDLGDLHWILGIEVQRIREERRILLSQRSYIDSILRRYGLDDLKPVSIPMDPNVRLTSAQSPKSTEDFARMRNIPYHEAVGSLMYASLGTRPDITYAVQTLSRFSTNPGIEHWEAVKRVFRYLKGTKEMWLSYGGQRRELEGYADADGSMAEDRRAVSGYAFLIHGGAVSWSAKRQEIVSLSTTESEYVAATSAAKEALWLRSLITELFGTNLDATTLFSDNQSAIALTKDHQYHARTKHIDIRFHFIRWIIEEGSLRLVFCPTADMVADALTKALPSPKVKHFAAELGLVSI